MNLTSIFRKDAAVGDVESGIVDHGWLTDGLIHPGEPQLDISTVKNPNNVKPQLEMQWGGGGDIDLNEPAGKVDRNLSELENVNSGPVILFARDMMNRGFSSARVASALKKRYGKAVLQHARVGLTDLFKMDGIIGRIAIDGRGYKNCKEAIKASSNSPYKRFIRCVIGCECGEPHMMPSGGIGGIVETESTGNPMDDFLASGKSKKSSMVAHCRSTMLPMVATVGDLDPSDLDSTFVEMMNVTSMPQGIKNEVLAMNGSSLTKIRAAFKLMDRENARAETAKYDGLVKTDRLVKADQEIELDDVGMSDLAIDDVNLVNPDMQQECEVEEVVPTNLDDMGSLVSIFDEVDLSSQPDYTQIPVDRKIAPVEIDMDEQPPLLDVEEGQFMDTEFEGVDEVPLDEPTTLLEEMGVEMMPRPDDEDEFFASK